MNEKLSDHVVALRRELNKLTQAFVTDHQAAMDSLMVKLDGIRVEIDALDAFVVNGGDERCQAVLRKKMSRHLSRDETKTLILDMGISDFDSDTNTLSGYHGELIRYCERREILQGLIHELGKHRPRVLWPTC